MSLLLLFPPPLVTGTVAKTAGNDTSATTAGYGPNGTLAVTAVDDSAVATGRAYAPFSSDTCIVQDEAGNPILDEAGNNLLIESCGPVAQPTGAGGKWDVTQSSRDAYRKARERQSMLIREDEELLLCLS